MKTITVTNVPAQEVEEGDFILGIDNGYVVDVVTEELRAFNGTYNVSLGEMTAITFHDAMGEECYLLMPPDSLVGIKPRPTPEMN